MKKLFICIFSISLLVLTGCSHRSDKYILKVMTLNVRYDNPRDGINAWPNRATQVTDFINDQKPDIFGMQEVLWHQYEFLDSLLTDYVSTGVGRDDGAREGELNPVFFRKERFDLVRTITFWLSPTPEIPGSKAWGSSLPRIVTWMELVEKTNHVHFFFFNTHFAHDSDSARIMSSKLLMEQVEKIAAGFPFIITGDLNMLPTSTGYSILTGPAESIPMMRDSYIISERKPAGPAYTFNGFSDERGRGRIDYIFVKNGLRVLDHTTVIKKERDIFISDHWPVIATVSLKEE